MIPAPPGRNHGAACFPTGTVMCALSQADSRVKFTGGASCRRQPALPESAGPGHRAGRAGIRGRDRGPRAASRTPRDQDAPGSEGVHPERGMAVDLWGSPGAVSGIQFTAAKGSASSASRSKPTASKLCGV